MLSILFSSRCETGTHCQIQSCAESQISVMFSRGSLFSAAATLGVRTTNVSTCVFPTWRSWNFVKGSFIWSPSGHTLTSIAHLVWVSVHLSSRCYRTPLCALQSLYVTWLLPLDSYKAACWRYVDLMANLFSHWFIIPSTHLTQCPSCCTCSDSRWEAFRHEFILSRDRETPQKEGISRCNFGLIEQVPTSHANLWPALWIQFL